MLKVSEISETCGKSEVDLFTLPPTQVAIEQAKWDTIQPESNFRKGTVVEFKIPKDHAHYLDLSQTELYCTVSVTDVSSSKSLSDYDWVPVNNFLHSQFNNICVKFNSTIVENSQTTYGYKAYIEDLLNYDNESKDTFLATNCWAADTPKYFDLLTKTAKQHPTAILKNDIAPYEYSTKSTSPAQMPAFPVTNDAKIDTITVDQWNEYYKSLITAVTDDFKKEQNDLISKIKSKLLVVEATKDGQNTTTPVLAYDNQGAAVRKQYLTLQTQMRGYLHLDSFRCNRYILNDVDVDLTLTKADPNWCTISTAPNGLEINIENIFLKVRRVRLAPSIMLRHAMELEKTTAKYPIKKVIVKSINFENGSSTQFFEICTGLMPNRVVFGFVDHRGFSGAFNYNPFNFQHFNIKSVSLKVASDQLPYTSPYTITIPNQIAEAYSSLFSAIKHSPNAITMENYLNGNFLFAYDLSPDLCSDEHYNLLKDGKMELECTFNVNTPTSASSSTNKPSINLIAYLEYDSLIEINKYRQVTANYS